MHTNHLGNSSAMTDINGNLIYKGQFAPYGQTLSEWSTQWRNTKKFTGYERDAATGLDYANARMYSSGRGRFLQADVAGLKAAKLNRPEGLNRYSYVYNDPVNMIDRDGKTGFPATPCGFVICDGVTINGNSPRGGGGGAGGGGAVGQEEVGIGGEAYGGGGGDLGDIDYQAWMLSILAHLPQACIDAFNLSSDFKMDDWASAIRNSVVKFYSSNSLHQLNVSGYGNITVADYWEANFAKGWVIDKDGTERLAITHGMTIVGKEFAHGGPTDARKYGAIILGPTANELTMIHEFLHWEAAGSHSIIVDSDHLNLAEKGYKFDPNKDSETNKALNEFLESGCQSKS